MQKQDFGAVILCRVLKGAYHQDYAILLGLGGSVKKTLSFLKLICFSGSA